MNPMRQRGNPYQQGQRAFKRGSHRPDKDFTREEDWLLWYRGWLYEKRAAEARKRVA